MGREQMRNLETLKIGGSQVNEFEYQKNQGDLTEQLEHHPDQAATGSKRLTQAERVKQIMAAAHKKVEKKRKKEAAKAGRTRKTSAANAPSKAAASRKGKTAVAGPGGTKKAANESPERKSKNARAKQTARKR